LPVLCGEDAAVRRSSLAAQRGVSPWHAGCFGRFAMHIVFFGMKRAHHATLGLTRVPLARLGLTPARFDLLYAVKQRRRGATQTALRKVLGVCRATVSKMLASLEKLGLVRRSVYAFDRRCKLVELTNRGKWRVARAYHELARSGWAQLAVDSALGAEGQMYRWYDEDDCREATSLFDTLLGYIRRNFGDRATLQYPWDLDEAESTGLDWEPFDLAMS
jgi:DNA-binding MarR family transcriptional regulator